MRDKTETRRDETEHRSVSKTSRDRLARSRLSRPRLDLWTWYCLCACEPYSIICMCHEMALANTVFHTLPRYWWWFYWLQQSSSPPLPLDWSCTAGDAKNRCWKRRKVCICYALGLFLDFWCLVQWILFFKHFCLLYYYICIQHPFNGVCLVYNRKIVRCIVYVC